MRRPERQRVAVEDPHHRHERDRAQRMHDRGEDVLLADHASVEERQRRRHEEDERGADEEPSGVTGVDGVHA